MGKTTFLTIWALLLMIVAEFAITSDMKTCVTIPMKSINA